MVLDAIYTNEHWIVNESIQPTNRYNIVLETYEKKIAFDVSYEDNLLLEGGFVTLDEVWNGDFFIMENIKYQRCNEKNVA